MSSADLKDDYSELSHSEMARAMADMARAASEAAPAVAALTRGDKDALLLDLADRVEAAAGDIKAANAVDVALAKEQMRPAAFIDRLTITDKTIASMANGLRQVAGLEDPVGEIGNMIVRPNGIRVGRMRIPLGVIGFIYESRPNVTIDAAGLCLKSGNAIILKGGSEALRSNLALAGLIQAALDAAGLPRAAAQLVPTADRRAVADLLLQADYIDLVIPRGGEGLIRAVVDQARMPVLKHFKGVCHLYVDAGADLEMAEKLAVNGKCQRPGTCNAVETLLVHADEAAEFLPRAGKRLVGQGVEIRGCAETCKLVPEAKAATEEDWSTEYLDMTLSVAVVRDMDAAMAHIAKHGSRHTEVICTTDHGRAMRFLNLVDASAVMVNASTRLNDGGELGLGAEIGISTDKLHAYGPMGLKELTTTKFVVMGSGQLRD